MGFEWKDGRSAALSFTFDDGLASHLDVAIPALEEHGFRGTYYLMTGNVERLERFRAPAERGHEIGNHSVRHICTASVNVDVDYRGLETMTLEEMAAELDDSDTRMRSVFREVDRFSFGYPCYNTFVGAGLERKSYVPLVAERFAAARAGGEISQSFNSPYHVDLHCVNSWKCERKNASELVGIVERTIRLGEWSVLTFHGINEGHLAVFEPDFLELLAYVALESEWLWVAPFLEVATFLLDTRSR